jgi:acyl carrier protein
MTTTNAIVRNALAHHLNLDPSTIQAWQHLELDLYLSPHDLAEVAREVEDVEDVVLPVEQLLAVATVGDLQSLVLRAVAREKPVRPMDRVALVTEF